MGGDGVHAIVLKSRCRYARSKEKRILGMI
jgi:hypothetical protein